MVDKTKKVDLLCSIVRSTTDQALVFIRTKYGANNLVKKLNRNKISSLAIHGNKSQSQRTKALNAFKNDEVQVLVATDIAARGLDIDQLASVINFDLPQVPEDYVHRIGRTGRAGARGNAISLVSMEEHKQLRDIERVIKKSIPVADTAEFRSLLSSHEKHNQSSLNQDNKKEQQKKDMPNRRRRRRKKTNNSEKGKRAGRQICNDKRRSKAAVNV